MIGKTTINDIWNRHFLDSAQVIDFINKNDKTLVDIGSGAGFPGVVLAIAVKDRKIPLKIKLIEKSPKKVKFLKNITEEFLLNVEVINQNTSYSSTSWLVIGLGVLLLGVLIAVAFRVS